MDKDLYGRQPGKVKADGFAFAGEQNWKAVVKTKYGMDPIVQVIYTTMVAIAGQDLKLDGEPPTRAVCTYRS